MVKLIVTLVVAALLGVGSGFAFSSMMMPPAQPAEKPETAKPHAPTSGDAGSAKKPDQIFAADPKEAAAHVVALEPVVVKLSEPRKGWVRLELSVVFAAPSKDDRSKLLKEMSQDLAAYLLTLDLSDLSSASAVEFMRDDLADIVKVRSKGQTRGILLKSLMVE